MLDISLAFADWSFNLPANVIYKHVWSGMFGGGDKTDVRFEVFGKNGSCANFKALGIDSDVGWNNNLGC